MLSDADGTDLEPAIAALVATAVAIVPELVGMSFSVVRDGVTFTYVATSDDVAGVDAAQYLDGGPCVRAATEGIPLQTEHDLLDEGQWQLFAQASAAAGIRSTLSLPIMKGERVTGGLNLYGPQPDTFRGPAEQLARALGAWEPGAVHNADLSFTTRQDALATPGRLADRARIDQAVGVLIATHRVDPTAARERLERAAAQAGVPLLNLANLVLEQDNN